MEIKKPPVKNSFLPAFLAGLAVPIFGMLFWFFAFFERKGLTWDQFIQSFQVRSMTRTRFLALGMLFLIPLFIYYYNRNNMTGMRGVLTALMLYAIIMGILFFV